MYAYTYAYLHTYAYAYLHLPYIHLRLYAQTDGQIDIYGRSKEQKTEDGRRKTEDGSIRVNRKKQAHALTSTLSTFVPLLLCSKLGHKSLVYDF